MTEYCCRSGKPMGLIDCDRCPDRNAYNRNLRDGLKINEAGWVAPDNYEHHENGKWRFVNWNVKTRAKDSKTRTDEHRVTVVSRTVITYRIDGYEFNSKEELETYLARQEVQRILEKADCDPRYCTREEVAEAIARNLPSLQEIPSKVAKLLCGATPEGDSEAGNGS